MNFINVATRTSFIIPSAQPSKAVIAPSNVLSSPNKSNPTVSKTVSCSNCATNGATTLVSSHPTIPGPQSIGTAAAPDSSKTKTQHDHTGGSSTSGTNGTATLSRSGNTGGEYIALCTLLNDLTYHVAHSASYQQHHTYTRQRRWPTYCYILEPCKHMRKHRKNRN